MFPCYCCNFTGQGPYGIGVISSPWGGGIVKTIFASCTPFAYGPSQGCFPPNPIYPPAASTFPPDVNVA